MHLRFFFLRFFQYIYFCQLFFTTLRTLYRFFTIERFQFFDNCFLMFDFPLLIVIGTQCFLPGKCCFLRILRIIAVKNRRFMHTDFHYFCDNPIQKIPVMGNNHNSTFVIHQKCLQPLNRFDIQVVRRLIQQDDIRMSHQQTRQRHTCLLSTGQFVAVFLKIILGKSKTF